MKKRKYTAPVIIVVLLCAYYIVLALTAARLEMMLWLKILAAAVPLLLCGVAVGVLIQRIREIKSGEEDDLYKY